MNKEEILDTDSMGEAKKKRAGNRSVRLFEMAGDQIETQFVKLYDHLWDNQHNTPQEMFDRRGARAERLVKTLERMETIIKGLDTDYEKVGHPFEITVNGDGTITVGDAV
jgi:hypothetical protein